MRNRSTFVLVGLLALALIGSLAPVQAQTPLAEIQVLMWDTLAGKWTWFTLDAGFTKTGNIISVTPAVAPPAPSATPVLGVALAYDATGNRYAVPSEAKLATLMVLVNGIRYFAPQDYTIVAGAVVPACLPGADGCNWPKAAEVHVDYFK
jgi:hypothetical protein